MKRRTTRRRRYGSRNGTLRPFKKRSDQAKYLVRSVMLQPMSGPIYPGEFGVLEMRHHAGLVGIGQKAVAGADQQRWTGDA
jgi:hypothetical protein